MSKERIKKSRKVTFQEDYAAGGMTIYKKDEVHAIHEDTVKALKENGAKMKVEKFDYEKMVEEAIKKLEDSNKEAAANA